MTTVKITELPEITTLQANTANTVLVGVDLPSTTTGKITLTTLAEGLFSNNNLVVGNNNIELSGAIAQLTGSSNLYIQASLQNISPNGSGDLVVTADNGTDTTYYIDVGVAGSNYIFEADTLNQPDDGYIIMVGDGETDPGGNLSIGTLTPGKNIKFFQGELSEANVPVKIMYDTGLVLTNKPLTFADGTTQNSAVTYTSVNSRITANTVTVNASIASNVATLRGEITGNIATQNTFAQAAFNKANSAIANTFGVATAGDFYMSGDAFVNGTFTLANSTFGVTEAAMTIKATATVQTPTQSGTMLQISGKADTPSRILFDSYSTDGSAYGVVAGRTARGTVSSPTASQNNDILMRLAGNGWGDTGFAPFGVARIEIVATENYSDTNRGSKIVFYNIPNGSNTVNEIASFNAESVTFDGVVNPAKGFIYMPKEFEGAQTAITIDFANDVVLKANCDTNIEFSFLNYTPGKQVEVWLTNTSGSNRTVTHGCSALNSTKNSTTFTIPSTATAWMKYYCVNGDLANTFVTVVTN